MTTNNQHLYAHGFSDASVIMIKGQTIKKSLDTNTFFERRQKRVFVKNHEKGINKKNMCIFPI